MKLSDFIAVFSSVDVGVYVMGISISVGAAFITLWIIAASLKNGIGPVPTSLRVKRKALTLMPEQVSGSIVELGAGWGGMTLALAHKYRNHQILAVENSVPVWCICWLRVRLSGYQNIEVRLGDIHQIGFDGVGLIYCYLFQGAMSKLAERLSAKQPEQNSSILFLISNTFALPLYTPEQTLRANDLWCSCIYRYRLSAPFSQDD